MVLCLVLLRVGGGSFRGSFVSPEVKQRRRVLHRAKTGSKLHSSRGDVQRFETLTTYKGYDSANLSPHFQILCKRVEHANFKHDGFDGFIKDYIKVTTSEGNGVIHALFSASEVKHRFREPTLDNLPNARKRKHGGSAVKRLTALGYIPHEWLKYTWAEITGNPEPSFQQVNIKFAYGGASKIANYLCQYVSGQSKLAHMSSSFGWVYRGFVRDWKRSFAPRLARLYSIGSTYDELNAVYREWDKHVFAMRLAC